MKKKIITAAILFVLGVALILGAVFYKPKHNARTSFDLTDSDIGKQVEMVMTDNQFPSNGNNYYLCYENDAGDFSIIRMTVPDSIKTGWDNSIGSEVTFTVTVNRAGDDVKEEAYDAAISFYEKVASVMDSFVLDDALRADTRDQLCDYCADVVMMSETQPLLPKLITGAAGALAVIVSVIFLIAALTRKKVSSVVLVFVIIFVVFISAVTAILFNKLRSCLSIKKEGEGIYSMTYYGDLKLDELISSEITDADEFVEWIRKNEFYNVPFDYQERPHGCSAFVSTSEDGDKIFGFNYDQEETDTLIIYIDPSDGYASYATAALYGMNIGTAGGYDPDSPEARALMLAAPYFVNDGINEEGLGVTFLQLRVGETHQDNGNPDIHVNFLTRLMLDRCATVDEAVELLRSFDVHTADGTSSHVFICDRTGRSVVVEWLDNEMSVVEAPACTNSALTPGGHYGEGYVDDRLPTLEQTLSGTGGVIGPSQARDLLDAVSQEDYTEWSCVYNLNDFCFTIYLDEDYSTPYTFGQ